MEKRRVLYISQEILPYVDESTISKISRFLPQGIQERGKEIRIFMPRYGCVNERRNQLHEVIRLSGMNLVVDDADHPLIIKVASIQQARMQVYFIDNEEYFQRKSILSDKTSGEFFADNDERALFFAKGVLETVKKLGWSPDVIHCHGWITSAVPILIKKTYKDDPLFANSKVVYSLYNDHFPGSLNPKYIDKLSQYENIKKSDISVASDPNYLNLTKLAVDYADGFIFAEEALNPELVKYINNTKKISLEHSGEEYMDDYSRFYDEICELEPVFAE